MNKRNKIRQEIIQKDGTKKAIFHSKKFSGDFKSFWRQLNGAPKPNSKRQQLLKQQAERDITTAGAPTEDEGAE